MRRLLPLVLLLAACSSSGDDLPPPKPPVVALHGPPSSTRLTPFPSDRYTRADASSATGLRVDVRAGTTADRLVDLYPKTVADLNTLDGFSTVSGVYVNLSGDVDPASFTRDALGYTGPDAPAALVDVDDKSPDKGKTVGLLPLYATTADGEYEYNAEDHTLLFQPIKPLRPGTRYLFVLTDRVKGRDGRSIVASEDTVALLRGSASGPYVDRVRAALPIALGATGIASSSVVLVTHFTTETVHEELLAAAADRRAASPPKLVGDLKVVEGPVADGRVRFAGKLEAPEYRTPKPNGRFAIEKGKPVAQSTAELEFLLAFSDAKKSGPRPVVIFGHGLGGDKDGVWGTAERLAALNVAVIGIDAPEHGSRWTGKPSDRFGPVLAFFGIDAQTKDESFVIARARDNFRQAALDQLELVRLVQSLEKLDVLPVGAPDGVPDLDPTKIVYLGHSFGSVMGPTVAALAPEIRAACWNVGGAGLTTLLRDSNTFRFLIDTLKPVGTPQGEVHRFFAVTQAIIDRGDPLNWARFVTLEATPGVPGWKPRDVLLQEVFGDTIVPNSSSELLARAAGLVHQLPKRSDVPGLATASGPIAANLSSGATGVFAQFQRGADGKLIDHGSLIFAPEGRAQYVEFFKTALEKGRATVPPPSP